MRLFKMRISRKGGHVHARVFVTLGTGRTALVEAGTIAAHPHRSLRATDYVPATWAGIGTLIMSWQDWDEFQEHLHGITIEPDDEEPNPVDPRRI
jgi:hypothetical protein